MSLVAAVAVAGFTSANAQDLAEAIKNVDVSGTVVYRYDDRNYDHTGDLDNNNYKIALTLKSKVNDDVTAVTRFIVGSQANGGFTTLNHATGGDGQADVSLSNVYFSYTGIKNTTVNVGKQGLTTPWTVAVDADGNEQTGTGILALSTWGPVTVAGAYFNQTNFNAADAGVGISGSDHLNGNATTDVLEGDENIATLGVMGNIGPVALDAWYLDLQDSFDTFTLGANAKFNWDAVKFNIGARHTVLDADDELGGSDYAKDDNSLSKIEAGLKVGIFGANVAYGWTDDEGGVAAMDADAKTGFQGWTLNLNGKADASLLKMNVNVDAMENLNIALNYNILDMDKTTTRTEDLDDEEIYTQITYKMSKNFGGYIRLGQRDTERAGQSDNDGTIGRLQVQYSF